MKRGGAWSFIPEPRVNLSVLMTGEGFDRGSYFIPQNIPTSEFVYPKKSLHF